MTDYKRYKVGYGPLSSPIFNPKTCCLENSFDLRVTIDWDGQHDGHLWGELDVECNEIQLAEEIINTIRLIVRRKIKEADPFRIHKDFTKEKQKEAYMNHYIQNKNDQSDGFLRWNIIK